MNSFNLLVVSRWCVPCLSPLPSLLVYCGLNFWKRNFVLNSVGYLKYLKFCFDAMLLSHRANFSLQAKNLAGIRLQTLCSKKCCWALAHFYLIKRKGQRALNRAFVSNFSYSLMSSFSLSCIPLRAWDFVRDPCFLHWCGSLVLRSASRSLFLFWTNTESVTFYLLDHFTFDSILWDFVYKNTGLVAFLNQGFGVGEDLHSLLQPSFIDHLPHGMNSVSF